MGLKKSYKHTEMGIIPDDWDVKELGELGEVKMCKRIFNYQTKPQGDIPFFKIGTFGKEPDAFIPNELYNNFKQRFSFPKKGTILISAAGTIGRTIVYDGQPAYFQDSNIVWIENDEKIISNILLFHILQTVNYNTEGGTIQRLYNSILKSTKFIYPLKSEQVAIATALSEIDELIFQTENLIQKKKMIKQGVMQELLKPKEGWKSKKISSIFKIFKGKGLSKSKLSESGSQLCILYGELFTKYHNEISNILSKTNYNEGVLSEYGDILFPGSTTTIGADLAKASTISIPGVQLGGDVIILRKITDEIDSLFITYFLNVFRKNEIAQMTKGITIHHLYGKDLYDIQIEYPIIEEQSKISAILKDFESELNSLGKYHSKLKLQKQGMMQTLLTGKIRLI